jgi:hypothetical protein
MRDHGVWAGVAARVEVGGERVDLRPVAGSESPALDTGDRGVRASSGVDVEGGDGHDRLHSIGRPIVVRVSDTPAPHTNSATSRKWPPNARHRTG